MAARLSCRWDNTEKAIKKTKKDRKAISEEMRMAILNVQQYLSQNGNCSQRMRETSKVLKLHRDTVKRIIKRGFV